MVHEVLPSWVQSVCDALVSAGVFAPEAPPNHVLLNEYAPGQGIDAHKDGPLYAPRVAILSLGSHTAFEFLEDDTRRRALASLLLPRRGLLVFEGDAYADALHTVPKATEDDAASLLSLDGGEHVAAHAPMPMARGRRISLTVRHVLSKGEAGAPNVAAPRSPATPPPPPPPPLQSQAASSRAPSDATTMARGDGTVRAADVASRHSFERLLDLVPDDEGALLLPLHPNSDGRAPMSYRALRRLAAELGEALLGSRADAVDGRRAPPLLAPHDRVATSLPSAPELAALFLGLSDSMPLAPLNPDLAEDEILFELEDLPAAALIVPAGRHSAAAKVAVPKLGLRLLVLTPDAITCGAFSLTPIDTGIAAGMAVLPTTATSAAAASSSAASAAASAAACVTRASAAPEATALVMHTSGTTRRPKLVPLPHRMMGVGALCVASTLRLERTALSLNVMPLFHLHGLMVNILVSAVAGASVLCAPNFDAARFAECLRAVGGAADGGGATADGGVVAVGGAVAVGARAAPSWYSAVPTIHQEVLRHAAAHRASTGAPLPHSLELIRNCSAALAPSIAEALETALPSALVLPTYAMTEALPICSNPRERAGRRLPSVGPAAGPDVRVAAQPSSEPPFAASASRTAAGPCVMRSVATAPEGEEGEVLVRGPCVFGGYEAREHLGYDPNELAFYATDAHDGAFEAHDGASGAAGRWLRTGDKGWVDATGHVHLTGRFKEGELPRSPVTSHDLE